MISIIYFENSTFKSKTSHKIIQSITYDYILRITIVLNWISGNAETIRAI